MAEEPVAVVEGAAGAPDAPEAAEVNLDELVDSLKPSEPAKPEAQPLDEDFQKKLDALDLGALPESFRRKLEAPFLSQYNKKTTEWDQERQRLLGLVEKLSSRQQAPQEPGVDERELLRQKIAEGDVDAIEKLVENKFQATYGKDIENIKLDNAYRTALQQFPQAAQMEPQMAESLKSNPGVAWVIKSVAPRDPALAGTLLAGLAKNLAYDDMAKKYSDLEKSVKVQIKQGIEEYQRRIGKLPSSTSRAGTTPVGEAAEAPKSLRDAMEAAWNEQARG